MNESKRQVQIRLHTAHDGERHTVKAQGHVYLKGRHIYIRFEEPGTERNRVATTIKIAGGEVTVFRQGGVRSEQRFAPGKTTAGYFENTQGSFRLETTTKKLDIGLTEGIGFVEWSYSLLVAGVDAGHFRLRLEVREDE
ncbi:DUF1934 domain-containing protein [Paenibacillus alkalitolerans]|uniref:DUF1934 domain-containing protein n=1 Tax=Paenibacillus alkalitolerans TaxID=2799335 RepID=UPI0018F4E9C0|nr:DUF1934 domain-containing protein [Paenibacillus alkalitolerans]